MFIHILKKTFFTSNKNRGEGGSAISKFGIRYEWPNDSVTQKIIRSLMLNLVRSLIVLHFTTAPRLQPLAEGKKFSVNDIKVTQNHHSEIWHTSQLGKWCTHMMGFIYQPVDSANFPSGDIRHHVYEWPKIFFLRPMAAGEEQSWSAKQWVTEQS